MMKTPMRLWTKVGLFYGLALLFSWGYWGVMIARGLHVAPGSNTSHLPGLMGPLFAAAIVIMVADGRAGLIAWLARFWRLPQRPWLTALVIAAPIGIVMAWFGWRALHGHPLPPIGAFAAYPGLPSSYSTLTGLLLVLVLNGYGEEAGWRAFLFEMLEAPLGRFRAVLVTIPLWLLWHLPLFFINLSMQTLIGPMLIGWTIGLAFGAFVLAHIYVFTGRSLLTVVVWHVVFNFCVATEATAGLAAAVVTSLIMVWGMAVAFAWGRQTAHS